MLTRLLFLAVGDLIIKREIPIGSDVQSYYFRHKKYEKDKEEKDTLLEVRLTDQRIIYFDGGFDSTYDHYGDEMGNIVEIKNPYHSWIDIWVQVPEPSTN